MRTLTEALQHEKDADGVTHVNRNAPGCMYCGTAEIKYSACGRVALHHPGSECCRKAIERLLDARKRAKTATYAEHDRLTREADDLEATIPELSGRDAVEARQRVASMRRGIRNRMSDGSDGRPQGEWHLRVHGNSHPDYDVIGLNAEIRELELKLRSFKEAV